MKAGDIIQFLEQRYPLQCQNNNDGGLQAGMPDKDVKKIAVAYEKTLDVISLCVKNGIDMLVTHRPLFIPERFGPPPKRWWDLFKEKIGTSNMVIYSLHQSLDLGENSTALCLAEELRLTPVLQKGCYLTCTTSRVTLADLVAHVMKTLKPDYMIAVGRSQATVERVGIVAGTAMDVKDVEYFRDAAVECYLSGDPDDFGIRYARDLELMTINVDDYCLERPGILRVHNILKSAFKALVVQFIDCRHARIPTK